MNEPLDPSEKHFNYSMAKSTLRLLSYVVLVISIPLGALGLFLAEILGIFEEM